MKKEILQNFPFTQLTCFALVLFSSVFSSIIYKTYSKKEKPIMDHLQNLPLEEDQ